MESVGEGKLLEKESQRSVNGEGARGTYRERSEVRRGTSSASNSSISRTSRRVDVFASKTVRISDGPVEQQIGQRRRTRSPRILNGPSLLAGTTPPAARS